MAADRPSQPPTADEQSFAFGESIAPPLLPFLNRGKKPTIYYGVAAGLLIIFPIYMLFMFDFVPTPFVAVAAASVVLLVLISRHYFSLVTEARVDATGIYVRGYRRFRHVKWTDLDSVTVSRQFDRDYVLFRLHPLDGHRVAIRRFRVFNKDAALSGNDPVQGFINAIRLHLVQRDTG